MTEDFARNSFMNLATDNTEGFYQLETPGINTLNDTYVIGTRMNGRDFGRVYY